MLIIILRINVILGHLQSLDPATRFAPPLLRTVARPRRPGPSPTVSQDRRIAVVHRFMHRKTRPRRMPTPQIVLSFIDRKTAFIPDANPTFVYP